MDDIIISFNNKRLKLNRQAALRLWLVANKMTWVDLGRVLGGISGPAVQMLTNRSRMPISQHNALTASGIPFFLLPPARDMAIGARPVIERNLVPPVTDGAPDS